ncbi:hypothetical protein TNIN_372671 [Trichonephila inaurata madagascariensis]|uniref:Uncharacterized protein n=1 Tax=Trichonephila inaurata madagascariensis TaxID=2747483 RepID=A0A8X6ITT5_9ARAC|nr:hypothetical protein TNIN_372671 [Trichonephila inaurata madagascariensis]
MCTPEGVFHTHTPLAQKTKGETGAIGVDRDGLMFGSNVIFITGGSLSWEEKWQVAFLHDSLPKDSPFFLPPFLFGILYSFSTGKHFCVGTG